MKKIIAFLLSFLMLISVTGCGSFNGFLIKDKTTEKVPVQPTTFEIGLSFVGDILLASQLAQTTSGSFNQYANTKPASYFFEKVKPIFEKDDFTIVNVENVFTDKALEPIEKDYSPAFWFKSKTSNIDILTSSSVEGVSLANNHINDYGATGKKDTMETIEKAGLPYGIDGKIMYFEKQDFRIAVICHGLWYGGQSNAIIKQIKTAEENSDYQIVFFHGGTEAVHQPEDWKVAAARKLADNGADLVIGNHPHVLQPREIHNGVEIIYSLGNFCFGGNRRPQNRTIIYQMNLTIDIKSNTVKESKSQIIPCYVYTGTVNNYQPSPVEDEAIKTKILDFMDGNLTTPV